KGRCFSELGWNGGHPAIIDQALDHRSDIFNGIFGLFAAVLKTPFGYFNQGVFNKGAIQLGFAIFTLSEGNWHLADIEAILDSAESQVHLEDIAGIRKLIEVNGFQKLATEGTVARGHIGKTCAQRYGNIDIAQAREVLTRSWPVDGFTTRNIAGANNQASGIGDLLQQQMQLFRRMGAVGIHFAQNLVVALYAPLKARDVCAQEAIFALAVNDVHVVIFASVFVS